MTFTMDKVVKDYHPTDTERCSIKHPQFKDVAGIDNDAADALSRLDLIDKSSDRINWEPKLPKMNYVDNTKEHNILQVHE